MTCGCNVIAKRTNKSEEIAGTCENNILCQRNRSPGHFLLEMYCFLAIQFYLSGPGKSSHTIITTDRCDLWNPLKIAYISQEVNLRVNDR